MMGLSPHPAYQRVRKAVQSLRRLTHELSKTAYRSVSPEYASDADLLSGEGARRYGGRWNPPSGFATIYASLTPETALAEALFFSRRAGLADSAVMPRVFVALRVQVNVTLSLLDYRVRRGLRIDLRSFHMEDWRAVNAASRESYLQTVGRASFDEGIEALVVPSAADRGEFNVVVFPEALGASSSVRIIAGT